jgi:hypothetical protein
MVEYNCHNVGGLLEQCQGVGKVWPFTDYWFVAWVVFSHSVTRSNNLIFEWFDIQVDKGKVKELRFSTTNGGHMLAT